MTSPATSTAEDERITRIEPRIDPKIVAPGAEIIDARGKYVFPGFIDPHVHIYLPFMGTYRGRRLRVGEQGGARGRDDHADRDDLSRAER